MDTKCPSLSPESGAPQAPMLVPAAATTGTTLTHAIIPDAAIGCGLGAVKEATTCRRSTRCSA